MIKIAVYGKGGIGKSTTISNLSVALANKGLKVMQIGCDPKADSTTNLHDGSEINTVLDLVRERKDDFKLDEMVVEGYKGILCVEAGGPTPGMGCAGRGIIAALEKLEQKGAYETYKPDIVFYDVLGDVVCGGFSMPMRAGYADKIFIITSGEYMAIHAAINIATAIDNFKDRGYASLGGVILNKRNVKNEEEKVNEFIENIDSKLVGMLDRDEIVVVAEEDKKTVLEAFPESLMAKEYEVLADNLLKACGYNPEASRYAGMSEKKIVILSMVISGFFSGIGGGLVYIGGTGRAFTTAEVTLPEGFNGIPVALLGMNSPLGCILAALFVSYINVGGNYMQACNIPVEINDVISAVIIYFSSFALMIRLYLQNRDKKKHKKETAIEGGQE